MQLKAAKAEYHSKVKSVFNMEHCWEVLNTQHKWSEYIESKTRRLLPGLTLMFFLQMLRIVSLQKGLLLSSRMYQQQLWYLFAAQMVARKRRPNKV